MRLGLYFSAVLSLTVFGVSAVPVNAAQQVHAIGKQNGRTAGASSSPVLKLTDAELGQHILDAAEVEAKSASPEVRAYVWMQVALQRGLDGQKNHEGRLLRDAYLATLEQPPQRDNTIFWIQQPILRQMMQDLGPQAVEEVFPKSEGPVRSVSVELLVSYYTNAGQFDQALAWLKLAPADGWFPFTPATDLMEKLPPSLRKDRAVIFEQVFDFCDGKKYQAYPLAIMITKFWRDLPRVKVVAAIDRILKEAAEADRGPIYLSAMVLPGNRSMYKEYRQEFLPILKELDPARAARLENEPDPPKDSFVSPPRGVPTGFHLPVPPELQTTPAKQVGTPVQPPSPVARSAQPSRKRRRVVNGCLVSEPWCRQNRMENALKATADHLRHGQTQLAKASIQRGFRLVAGELDYDTDPSDPNLAIKSAWPSAVNAEAFAVLATRVSPEYALKMIGGVRDSDIQLMARVVLARMWLGARPFFGTPSVLNSEGIGGECIQYYAYITRQLFSWAY